MMSHQDFDFLLGRWNVVYRRLKERLVQCEEWTETQATDEVVSTLGGYGNLGTFRSTMNGNPYTGHAVRLFSPATGLWSIYWMDTAGFKMEPPVVGGFDNGVGLFYGDDVWAGQLIRVRFTWDNLEADRARWQQAFSVDNGANWEVNAIMEFVRA